MTEADASRSSAFAWWPPVAVVVIYAAGLAAGHWLSGRWWMSQSLSTGGPPWYFIGQDLVGGLVLGAGLGIGLLVAFATRRRLPEASWMAVWMSALWMGYPFAQSLYVIARSSRLWDPVAATTAWPTFSAYVTDPLRYIILVGCLTGSVVLAKRGRVFWT